MNLDWISSWAISVPFPGIKNQINNIYTYLDRSNTGIETLININFLVCCKMLQAYSIMGVNMVDQLLLEAIALPPRGIRA